MSNNVTDNNAGLSNDEMLYSDFNQEMTDSIKNTQAIIDKYGIKNGITTELVNGKLITSANPLEYHKLI